MMRQFAESRACRGQALLAYFGDQLERPCGHCDNCARRPASAAPVIGAARCRSRAPAPARPRRARGRPGPRGWASRSPRNSTVRHMTWGIGTVLGYYDDRMTVLFDSVGYKTLSVSVVAQGNLIAVE